MVALPSPSTQQRVITLWACGGISLLQKLRSLSISSPGLLSSLVPLMHLLVHFCCFNSRHFVMNLQELLAVLVKPCWSGHCKHLLLLSVLTLAMGHLVERRRHIDKTQPAHLRKPFPAPDGPQVAEKQRQHSSNHCG